MHFLIITSYLLYHLFFALCFLVAINKYPQFSFSETAVSALGMKSSPAHRLVNIVFVFYGLLTVVFSFVLIDYLPSLAISQLGIWNLKITGLLITLIGLLPWNKKYARQHYIVALLAFLAIVTGSVIFIVINLYTSWLTDKIVLLNLVSIIFGLLFLLKAVAWNKTKKWTGKVWVYEWLSAGSGFFALFLLTLTLFLLFLK